MDDASAQGWFSCMVFAGAFTLAGYYWWRKRKVMSVFIVAVGLIATFLQDNSVIIWPRLRIFFAVLIGIGSIVFLNGTISVSLVEISANARTKVKVG